MRLDAKKGYILKEFTTPPNSKDHIPKQIGLHFYPSLVQLCSQFVTVSKPIAPKLLLIITSAKLIILKKS